jgi:hypothetical protein
VASGSASDRSDSHDAAVVRASRRVGSMAPL